MNTLKHPIQTIAIAILIIFFCTTIAAYADTYWSGTGNDISSTNSGFVGIGTTTPTQQLEITKNFKIPLTSSSTVGVIYQGANRFIHSYGGSSNVFVGSGAGNFSLSSSENLGFGSGALAALTSGGANAAFGFQSLTSNTTGQYNTAFGRQALYANTTGSSNAAQGRVALYNNTVGGSNLALGDQAMFSNVGGNASVAVGGQALQNQNPGSSATDVYNTGIGYAAGHSVTTGRRNTFIGGLAGLSGASTLDRAMAFGYNSTVSQNNSLAIGGAAGGADFVDVIIGGTAPSAALHVIKSTRQQRLGFDASKYFDTTVGSAGGVVFDAVGTTSVFNFLDNVGIGTTTPTEALEVNGNVKLTGNIVSDGDICIGTCD